MIARVSWSSFSFVSFAIGAALAAVVVALAMFRRTRAIRARAIRASRSVLVGQAAEQIAPLTGAFVYAAHEARFLGHPIDYVIFDGLDEDDAEVDVVFAEIKSGNAKLSVRERRIRSAIEAGRVRFEIIRL